MVIKFRILLDTEKNVFRDIEIEDSQTFEALHYSILDAFEWEADEMASFYASNEDWEKGDEIPLMDIQEEFGPKSLAVMSQVTLADHIKTVGQKHIYVFDFLLMWCFYVDVLEIKKPEEGAEYPQLTLVYGDVPSRTEKAPVDFSGQKDESDMDDDDDEDDDDAFNFEDLINN